MRGRQHGQIVELLMDVRTSALRLDSALEASIIPIIRSILDLQIVNSPTRSKVQAESKKRIKEKISNEF